MAIRRKWPLYVAFISEILYTAPTWVALLLLTLFFRRSEYLAPLVAAVVISAITSSLMLLLGGRSKNWVVGDQADLSRTTHASFRYPFSSMMAIVLIVGFGLPVTQFSSEVRTKAIVAFGVTAVAILVACFYFRGHRPNQLQEVAASTDEAPPVVSGAILETQSAFTPDCVYNL